MERFDGRVAVVTGGAAGIGRETALALARAGATVAVWDRVAVDAELRAAVAGDRVLDVVSRDEVAGATAETLERHGRIDVLINNAGILRDAQLVKLGNGGPAGGMTEADFDAVIAVNLKGVFNCTQAVVPAMLRQGYGRIVSASSIVGIYGNFGQTSYVASKAAVIGMTKVWARELGPKGITANAVAPGFIATEMIRGMPPKIIGDLVQRTPARRMGTAADVVRAYLFLAAEAASYLNGVVLSVDGGLVVGT